MKYYIIIRGPLGCGKSTISEKLAKKLNAKHIVYDRILDKYNLTGDKEEGMISRKSFLKANKIAVIEAKKILDRDKPVIFDGNFYWREQINNLIKNLKYKYYVFTLKADLKVCIGRDSKRSKVYGKYAAEAVYNAVAKFEYGMIIDNNSKTVNEVVREIISYLNV